MLNERDIRINKASRPTAGGPTSERENSCRSLLQYRPRPGRQASGRAGGRAAEWPAGRQAARAERAARPAECLPGLARPDAARPGPSATLRAAPAATGPAKTHLAELFALMLGQQRSQRLEARVDALHASPLVGVGDLSPDALLLLHVARRRSGAFTQPATEAHRVNTLPSAAITLFRHVVATQHTRRKPPSSPRLASHSNRQSHTDFKGTRALKRRANAARRKSTPLSDSMRSPTNAKPRCGGALSSVHRAEQCAGQAGSQPAAPPPAAPPRQPRAWH